MLSSPTVVLTQRHAVAGLAFLCVAATALLGCRDGAHSAPASPHPFVVVGVDGAEWAAIERLWEDGQLPELARIAREGVRTHLATNWGKSPVIWTSVATGVQPRRHGILDFVAMTPRGNVPVTSDLRKVPAIWNMASTAERRVAVLGWLGSWPAEEVHGVMVTTRLLLESDDRLWPPDRTEWLEAGIEEALDGPRLFDDWPSSLQKDEAAAHLATRLAGEDFDLLMILLRAPDVVSHIYWKYFEPSADVYEGVDPELLERYHDKVPSAYRAVDTALTRILNAAPAEANVIVLSDHGFRAGPERVRVALDFDALLRQLGFLMHREGTQVLDMARTRLYTHRSPAHDVVKRLRFPTRGRDPGGGVRPDERERIRRELEAALDEVTYGNGHRVFDVRDPTSAERRQGADLIAEARRENADDTLLLAGEPVDGVVRQVTTVTGGHPPRQAGIFLAAGPDIDPDADLDGMSVLDITPTLLYGLGLPVAEDFDGEVWKQLYTRRFRRQNPLQTISTWGVRDAAGPKESEVDDEILGELRALGYLD